MVNQVSDMFPTLDKDTIVEFLTMFKGDITKTVNYFSQQIQAESAANNL